MKKPLPVLVGFVILVCITGGLLYHLGDTAKQEPAVQVNIDPTDAVHIPEEIVNPSPDSASIPEGGAAAAAEGVNSTPDTASLVTSGAEKAEKATQSVELPKQEEKTDTVRTDNADTYGGWPAIPASMLPQPDSQMNGGTVVIIPGGNDRQTGGDFLGIRPNNQSVIIPGYNTESPVRNTAIGGLAKQIFDLVNAERTAGGLKALTYAYDLQDAADTRAREASVSFSHTRPDGSSCHDIVKKDCAVTGENLILADKAIATAENLVAEWMSSEGHRYNILLPDFTEIAIGVYEKDGVVYAAQIFAG